ncbi:MAG TPA: Stp1/IreP family PP2C-type Ser/Thr phosphatase [Bryobacteraceae bacterium]|nr:Stp1/IreP family PP2C-type Ser/Thr phosphatase [Bryobacteraceae bacterium]
MATPGTAQLGRLIVSTSVATDKGCVRELNEDCCGVVQPAEAAILDHKGVLIVLADGMGGYRAGEIASRIAVESVAREYYISADEPKEALTSAFQDANSQIHNLSLTHSELNGMGTTCTALVILGRVAYSAHAGDSRLYLVRSGSIYQMTEDHSVVSALVKQGALTFESARNHPARNLILKALGTHATVNIATWDQPLPVHSGDCFVLCSDGLHDAVSAEEICLATQSGEAAAACECLVATARSRGGADNITVAVARVD